VKQRLELINLIIQQFNPEDTYNQLKVLNDKINKDINELKEIKDNIILYYKDFYQDIMQKIRDVIKTSQNKKISEYKKGGKIGDLIKESQGLKDTAKKIKRVKNFLLFNVIYDIDRKKDENETLENSFKILDEIGEILKDKKRTEDQTLSELNDKYKKYFKKIKEKLCNNEDENKADNFIDDFKTYYNINDENLIIELSILFKSKKYELDINSIIFFFKYKFEKDNENWNNKFPSDYINRWEESFQSIKDDLNELKKNQIYDYTKIEKHNKFFTCLYEKKEAIDFLFTKTSEEIAKLKDKIQPTDVTINVKNIDDAEKCAAIISIMRAKKDNFQIFEYIKGLSDETITQFENYSKIYSSIIELYIDDDISVLKNGEVYGFRVYLISEDDVNWNEKILERIKTLKERLNL